MTRDEATILPCEHCGSTCGELCRTTSGVVYRGRLAHRIRLLRVTSLLRAEAR